MAAALGPMSWGSGTYYSGTYFPATWAGAFTVPIPSIVTRFGDVYAPVQDTTGKYGKEQFSDVYGKEQFTGKTGGV